MDLEEIRKKLEIRPEKIVFAIAMNTDIGYIFYVGEGRGRKPRSETKWSKEIKMAKFYESYVMLPGEIDNGRMILRENADGINLEFGIVYPYYYYKDPYLNVCFAFKYKTRCY